MYLNTCQEKVIVRDLVVIVVEGDLVVLVIVRDLAFTRMSGGSYRR